MEENDKVLRGVDLFCGCGGMSLGFERAGIDVVCAFDHWAPVIDVYRQNFAHPCVDADLSDVDGIVPVIREISPNVIFGGPPCQDFSFAGRGDESRGRARLTLSFAEIVSRVRPRWFVMENVPAIRRSQVFSQVIGTYHDSGYGVTVRVLDASLCGVPQKRKRMFVIGMMGEHDDFLGEALDDGLSDKPMTIRDYLGDALGVENYYNVQPNYRRRSIFSIDEPAPTMRGQCRPVPPGYKRLPGDTADPSEVRCLTPKERSLIQTFPADFRLDGSKTAQNQMIGNAVPVNLAKYVATAVVRHDAKQRIRYNGDKRRYENANGRPAD